MANVEAVRRHRSKTVRVGIDVLQFRWLNGCTFLSASALMQHHNVAELYVFDVVTRNSGDDCRLAGGTVGDDDITNQYAAQLSHRSSLGTTHSASQAQKERNVDEVPHGDVGDGDVLHNCAVYALAGNSPAILNHAVADGHVA